MKRRIRARSKNSIKQRFSTCGSQAKHTKWPVTLAII